jgi:hypothetical protein
VHWSRHYPRSTPGFNLGDLLRPPYAAHPPWLTFAPDAASRAARAEQLRELIEAGTVYHRPEQTPGYRWPRPDDEGYQHTASGNHYGRHGGHGMGSLPDVTAVGASGMVFPLWLLHRVARELAPTHAPGTERWLREELGEDWRQRYGGTT